MKEVFVNLLAVGVALAIGAALGVAVGRKKSGGQETVIIQQIDTVVRVDTIRESYPEPVYVRVVDSIRVPVPGRNDTIFVSLPREEKVYEDSTYRAVVSGFLPSLDTIDVFRRIVFINTETIVRERYRKRWSLTAGPQVGVGITPQGWQPYAGAGVTFGYSF